MQYKQELWLCGLSLCWARSFVSGRVVCLQLEVPLISISGDVTRAAATITTAREIEREIDVKAFVLVVSRREGDESV
jgi:hypothetical protein